MQAPDGFELASVVPVFHKWIQNQSLPGHLLIDVADYMHVEDGPGVVLVSHEANIGLERQAGEFGLTYLRKRPFGTTFSDRVITTARSAWAAAAMLQSDVPGVRFAADRLQVRLLDKLSAPNDAATARQVLPELERVFGGLFGAPVRVHHHPDPLKHFEATVETGSSPSLSDLLKQASAAAV
jgi:hypothetical protein